MSNNRAGAVVERARQAEEAVERYCNTLAPPPGMGRKDVLHNMAD
jgi:hypothetical protein